MKSSTACWIFLNNHLISVFDYLARVWHALVTTMDTSKQIISVILANWSSTEKQKLTRRSELKMTMNNVRVQQIKEDFWKVRLAELIIHEERFLQHELVRKWNLKKNLCTYIYTGWFKVNVYGKLNAGLFWKFGWNPLSIWSILRSASLSVLQKK